jgi:hypothetical protein
MVMRSCAQPQHRRRRRSPDARFDASDAFVLDSANWTISGLSSGESRPDLDGRTSARTGPRSTANAIDGTFRYRAIPAASSQWRIEQLSVTMATGGVAGVHQHLTAQPEFGTCVNSNGTIKVSSVRSPAGELASQTCATADRADFFEPATLSRCSGLASAN